MTSSIPMPVIPDPSSDDTLFKMLKMILENPLCIKVNIIELDVSLRLKNRIEKEYYFCDVNTLEERKKLERIIKVNRKYHKLPVGREGAEKGLKIIRKLKEKERSKLPEVLQKGDLIVYTLNINVDWVGFKSWLDVKATVSPNTRKLEICYYPNSLYNDPRVYDKTDHMSHLTKPFIDLFQQIKSMFQKEWPDKYIILPSISDRKERSLILSELRIEPFEPSKYRKLDEYLR